MRRLLWALVPAVGSWVVASCAPAPTITNPQILNGTDRFSLLCLSAPADLEPRRPMSECTHVSDADRLISDFGPSQNIGGSGGGFFTGGTNALGQVPHLYAMTTQIFKGEVAMVDLTATTQNVLDTDPSTPGTDPYPVGVAPTAIVSTPGGTATFVATAEISRPEIYALPTKGLRPCAVDTSNCNELAPTLSSWPACGLPSQPGAMVMIADPVGGTGAQTRKSCDSPYADVPTDESTDPNAVQLIDMEGDGLNGRQTLPGGRQKLVVALPRDGELVVIDAQTLLETAPGSTAPCIIERTIMLDADVKPNNVRPPPPQAGCVNPKSEPPGNAPEYVPQPDEMTMTALPSGNNRLYVSDTAVPVIHVLNVADPCEMDELDPLLLTSDADPTRIVTASALSVTPRPTASNKSYVYATDVDDKSLMVFDVSDDSTQRTPLHSPNGALNPLQPVDRIQLSQAPKTIQIMVRDQPKAEFGGVVPFGTLCNPIPGTVPGGADPGCMDASPACQGVAYRTTADYTAGAGPLTLRGMFALVGLSGGEIAVMDIEDYDAPCRTPNQPSTELGCPGNGSGFITSFEGTCGVVVPNEPRSNNYIESNDTVGRHLPGLTTFPLLYDKDTTLINVIDTTARMTTPPNDPQTLSVDGIELTPNSDGLITDDNGTEQNALLMNLAEPRAQAADQDWTVTFEGALPSFATQQGSLDLADQAGSGARQFHDAGSSRFCSNGVQSFESIREKLAAKDPLLSGAQLDTEAAALADRFTITNPLPDSANAYWMGAAGCNFEQCSGTFGDDTVPTSNRDITIHEAYEDHLDLEAPHVDDKLVHCCFPENPTFQIRPGNQWVVVGSVTGFLHHVIADTSSTDGKTGVCRDSCDPRLARLNGRVLVSTAASPNPFLSPQFRFLITNGGARDDSFHFTAEGSFQGLSLALTNANVTSVTPQSMSYLPVVDRILLTDGGTAGIFLVPGTIQGTPVQLF